MANPADEATAMAPPAALPLLGGLALAEQYRGAGRLAEAETICKEILNSWPSEPNAEHLIGLVAYQSGRLDEAIGHLERAVALAPKAAAFHANLGEMCRAAGRTEQAVTSCQRAVALDPQSADALTNLGAALYEQKRYHEAAACHRRALALRPSFALGHRNLGNSLFALKRYDKAVAAYRQAIALDPAFADAWSNLGTTLHHAGRYEEAISALHQAIAHAPNHPDARSGLGILLLMRGDFAAGWPEYEWRLRSTEAKGAPVPQRPWRGERLAGRHIYVQAEQGFGDTLQFVRYLPWLEREARAVSLRVQEPLTTLIRGSFPGVKVLGDGEGAGEVDCDCALLSLPGLFSTRLESIPASVPYLRAPDAITQRWQDRLSALPGLKVGVVWAGRPQHVNDFRRSIAISTLAPLFAVQNVSWVSLQVGPRTADLKGRRAAHVESLTHDLTDFAESAGAANALDLIITVDTSMAHLAGALGRPVWVLLPWVSDWRWLLEREDNPWYPTMRLFRQSEAEDWADVVTRVARELRAVALGDHARLTPYRAEGERRAAIAAAIIDAKIAREEQT